MSYSDYLRRTKPYQSKYGRVWQNYDTDQNNNCKNIKINSYKTQLKREPSNKTHFDQNNNNVGCLKLNDRSHGVRKFTTKTPAQDRLQRLVAKNKLAIAESLKKLVEPKSSVRSLIQNKSSTNNKTIVSKSNRSVECANVNDSIKSTLMPETNKSILSACDQVIKADESLLKEPSSPNRHPLMSVTNDRTTHSKLSTNVNKKHDAQNKFPIQSHLKINDKSKAIGAKKVKSKMPAQERIQKWADKKQVAIFESIKELVDMPTAITDAKSMRKSMGLQKSHITGVEPSITDVVSKTATVTSTTDSAYIIPDTNVFIHSLACIKNVIEKDSKHTILIPYVVLQELDKLKCRRGENSFTLKLNATRAIRYIYDLVQVENKRLRGQMAIDDTKHLINISSNDDKILNCCLQLIGQSKKVILVTNDLNLTNIAKLNGVETITFKACSQRFQ